MASPITWKNVNSRVDPGAVELLRGANTSFTNAFSGLGDIVQDYQNTQRANNETIRGNNTQQFLDRLAQYRTPEEYQAAVQSGELDNFRQSFGGLIDRGQVRDAQQNRLSELQSAANRQSEFEKNSLTQRINPLAEQYRQLKLANHDDDAEKLLQDNYQDFAGAGMLSQLAEYGVSQDRREKTEGRADEEHEFNIGERNRAQLSRTLNEALNRSTNQEAADLLERRAQNEQSWNQLATETGVMRDGVLDYDNASSEQIEAFKALADQQGLTAPISDTQAINEFRQKLLSGFSTMPGEQLDAAVARFAAGLDANAQIANQDIARRDSLLATAAQNTGIHTNSLYTERDAVPAEAVSEILSEKMASDKDFAEFHRNRLDGNRQSLAIEAVNAIENGIDLDGEKVYLSPSDIKAAINGYGDSWGRDDRFGTVLKNYARRTNAIEKNRQYQSYLAQEAEILNGFPSTVGSKWDANSAAAALDSAAYRSRAAQAGSKRENTEAEQNAARLEREAEARAAAETNREAPTNTSVSASGRALPDTAANREAIKRALTYDLSQPIRRHINRHIEYFK